MNLKNKFKILKIGNKNWLSFPFFLMISFFLYSFIVIKGNNQNSKHFLPDKNDSISVSQPKVDIKVNKKYDEKGNLIQYDSSYSIIYSSPNTDVQFFNFENDSLFTRFKNKMGENDFFNNDFFNNFPEFGLNQDFFQMNPMLNLKQIHEEMIKKMKQFQQPDSNIIQNQNNIQSQPNTAAPNMITL
ncbi:MAG: hypothetical protein HXX18_04360 [Bacteroidetes bacterium]|nr:hypothetical protein [Bacteroidota bacterium]